MVDLIVIGAGPSGLKIRQYVLLVVEIQQLKKLFI